MKGSPSNISNLREQKSRNRGLISIYVFVFLLTNMRKLFTYNNATVLTMKLSRDMKEEKYGLISYMNIARKH